MRLATQSDARSLAVLAMQVWLHTYATDGIRSAISEYVLEELTPGRFEKAIADPLRALLVEESDGHLLGYSELAFDMPCPSGTGVTTEVSTLYVQEHFARKGIGTKLMDASAELARERTGSQDLWLSVYAENPVALAFYERQGFVRAGTLSFELGTELHENYVLVRLEDTPRS